MVFEYFFYFCAFVSLKVDQFLYCLENRKCRSGGISEIFCVVLTVKTLECYQCVTTV
jgi:hypothetical protein